jgi:hypothetical protein
MFAEKMSYGLNDDVGSSVRSSAGSASAAWPSIIVGLTSRTRAKLPKRDRSSVVSRDQRFAEPIVLADGGKLGPLRPAGGRGSIRRGEGGIKGALGPSGLCDVKLNAFRETGSRIVHGY